MSMLPSYLSSSMRLRPLHSTLLPYTTLFRSVLLGADADQRVGLAVEDGQQRGVRIGHVEQRDVAERLELQQVPAAVVGRELDRKSTRLNSSHVAISYAVFCLKKKKKTDSLH